ncbi:MAG TPA: hypothetical protein VIM59_06285, partial [Cellvibrio sp.]
MQTLSAARVRDTNFRNGTVCNEQVWNGCDLNKHALNQYDRNKRSFNKSPRKWLRFIFCSVLLLCAFVYAQGGQAQTWNNSYFRGTPNNWAATPLTKNTSSGLWETQQTFSGANPRFKISRYADNWNEAYPAQDYLITNGDGDYKITFNDATKAVVVTRLPVSIPANNICFNNPANFATPYIY